MTDIFGQIKTGILSMITIAISAIAPTKEGLLMLIIFSVVNIVIGWRKARAINKERFSWTKLFNSVTQLSIYLSLVILIHLAFWLFNEYEMAVLGVRVVCWVGVWGYSVKILQNACQLSPNARGFKLLYRILAIDFLPKLLQRFGITLTEEELKDITGNDADDTTAGAKEQ